MKFTSLIRNQNGFPKKLSHFPMKLLVTTAQLPLYKSSSTSPLFLHSKSQPKSAAEIPNLSNRSMGTCVDTCSTTAGRRDGGTRQQRTRDTIDNRNFQTQTQTQTPPLDRIEETTAAAVEDLWAKMREEASLDAEQEPILSGYYYTSILSQTSLEGALANHLAVKLCNSSLPIGTLFDIFAGVLGENPGAVRAVKADLRAVKERDPACISYVHCFLGFKGFLAIQAHRVAHELWRRQRKALALLIQNRVSEVFGVDIHPGARIGEGVLLDHATGVVIGETAEVGNDVSILHGVTLGGTGKIGGDRHPKIGDGVLIGAGTCVLGNIRVGAGAKIGACSVVLKEVPARTTAVGNPARLIGGKENPTKLDKMPSFTMDHTSHIAEWSDYVI
ncbi:unnamed protein product [Linum tenue]|uniref:serine O-acetyltransferase n=2 Tax=Linum tenue TaxID=586396 RepID=A0AAV0H0Q5_9ROSI|nr:unnamed protein product [Linum tenue]